MAEVTPMMLQYRSIKKDHPDNVLFFRLGDFYEMFDDDAVEVSRLLNLTLTHRAGQPMCGIPYHAAKIYIARLLRLGKKIAICEQVNLPQNNRSLAERKVVEIITPGTALEEEYLEQSSNNFLASMCFTHGKAGFAYIDISTSAFYVTSWPLSSMAEDFAKELGRCMPKEILLPQSLKETPVVQKTLSHYTNIIISYYPDWQFSSEKAYKRLLQQFQMINLRSFGLTENSPEIPAAGFVLEYLSTTSNTSLPHITTFNVFHDSDYMIIDDASRRNLELISNLTDGSSSYTLFETINYGETAMGKRLLRNWLLSPLKDCNKIQFRQNRVAFFVSERDLLTNVRSKLSSIYDIERLTGRISMDKAHAKDLQTLRYSLESWLLITDMTKHLDLTDTDLSVAEEIIQLIKNSILEDPSALLTEGRIIQEGWSSQLDYLRQLQNNFNNILNSYIEEEKEITGISNLKVRYNRISGYYIEVSKGKLDSVPSHFILRRTMVNGDRYTTEKLQELEHELNSAGEKIIETEKKLFLEIRNKLKSYSAYLLQIAKEISQIDAICSFAHSAILHNWVQPEIVEDGEIKIEKGRHPVVELHIPSGEFVPNDAFFSKEKYFALVTGPNMAGKSTYLRQNALITLLAQTGSFVPATKAKISIVDRIFCRVGASDNLAKGESTFLVEMTETAHILRNATENSLVIMDEVGRGTSTEDGLSIAWAISEYLLNSIKCKTLFATHYHQLTRMTHDALILLCLDVLEQEGQITFLKRIKSGAAANSYGIHVAQLAGVPTKVISRAKELLKSIQTICGDVEFKESIDLQINKTEELNSCTDVKFSTPCLFSDEELVLDEILSANPDTMSPIEALLCISRWKKTLSGK
ncbi:MAG: DNA mismatch repair protein MutS [Spirochaetaceae bacterium]|nr:DNA mismatch repair protein MutS [Spirochaetaceae bacterium]